MAENWTDVAALSCVPDMCVVSVSIAGKEIALYEVNGDIFATDNLCTHGAGRMSDGFLEGDEIECPLHQGRFNVCTGKAMCAPLTTHLQTYPVQIRDQRIWINLAR
ncbi:MAG: non-heme iron oxygenase ferredoxin subunit [Cytophagales bacterium]|nr:non-heme iron oxygenase ferredoxin subunit [Cytophagales bacterium]